ncbi:hypothetical protein HS088_TW09G00545 [Tripterygium wilfordii]|uniref:Uncharacterized protein n=1 Tax=Tripterygium wilfordii TaxID=458696 RepID=A0A7J7D8W1_TRIWF|nr:hypothetical protein HS088_TW09G00545 [Tripterygium wilfordii]
MDGATLGEWPPSTASISASVNSMLPLSTARSRGTVSLTCVERRGAQHAIKFFGHRTPQEPNPNPYYRSSAIGFRSIQD